MNLRFARFLSVLLHPTWMPAYVFIILFQTTDYFKFVVSQPLKTAVYFILLLNTILIPLLIIYFLFRKGLIQSYRMEERQDRSIPYLVNMLCMLLAFYMMSKLPAPKLFGAILFGAAIALAVAFFINLRWKISIHMIGIGGFAGVFYALSDLLLMDIQAVILVSFLLAGLLGTARLLLNAHVAPQIYAGFVLGFACEYFILNF